MNKIIFMFLLVVAILTKFIWFYYYYALYFIKEEKFKGDINPKEVGLICPVYNEDPNYLKDTINNSLTYPFKEIIFVDDGSTNKETKEVLLSYKNKYKNLKIIFADKNRGKRHAQKLGLDKLNKSIKYVVLIDSDSIIDKKSIYNLLKPYSDKNVGGTTGVVLAKNRNQNILTRTTNAMFWSGSYIWKRATSKLGFVQVSSGALSSYKREILDKLMPEYLNQKFMGVYCSMSDDRWLTQHTQTDLKKRIIFVKDAIAYTYVPHTFKKTLKMLFRWKKGAIRESILILNRAFKKFDLTIDIWLNLITSLAQVIIRIIVFILIFYNPIIILNYILIVSLVSLLFSYEMIFKAPKEIPYRIGYSLLNELIYWVITPYSLIRIKDQGRWGTR